MSYDVYKGEIEASVVFAGVKYCGFDTGHPSLLVQYRFRAVTNRGYFLPSGLYSHYIALDGKAPTQAADAIANVFEAFGVITPAKRIRASSRKLTTALQELASDVSLMGKTGDLKITSARTTGARTRSFWMHIWGGEANPARDQARALRTFLQSKFGSVVPREETLQSFFQKELDTAGR